MAAAELNDPYLDLEDSQTEPETFGKLHEKEVYRVVKDINISKSSGLNNGSSFILKEAFLFIIPAITHMFNLSMVTAKFPAEWKKALIILIPKAGDSTLVQKAYFSAAPAGENS